MPMGKSTRTQRLREKMRVAAKQSRQTTLDSLPKLPKKESAKTVEPEHRKQIIITEIETVTKEDELALNIGFRLLPSKTAFSKITADLHFDEQKIHSTRISILPSPLASDDFELTPALDMKGIAAGSHKIRVDMYEISSPGEKLGYTSKEITIEYVPLRREDRFIKIPIVKSVAGADFAILKDSEKRIYQEMEEDTRREENSKRDEW
jgi:hypothetical protein